MKSNLQHRQFFSVFLAAIGATLISAGATSARADNLDVLHSFQAAPDAQQSFATLIIGGDGRLYGTSSAGGAAGVGTVFAVGTDGTGFTVLHDFNDATDGSTPSAALVKGSDGRLYGTTYAGGLSGAGTLFAIGEDGTGFTVLRHLNEATDGANVGGALIQGGDGRLYGMATSGGAFGYGTLFAIGTGGAGFTVLRNLNISVDGGFPSAGFLKGADGRLYGTVTGGGALGFGTLFAIAEDGSGFTVLRSMNGPVDGAFPVAGLVQGSDGRLYGTAYSGGTFDFGTVFAIGTDGTGFTVLRNLSDATDGANPYGSVIQGADGRLYGSSLSGGTNGAGTLFAIGTNGAGFAVLRQLNPLVDGASPYGALVQGGTARLYGTTWAGGATGNGTVFVLKLPVPVIDSPLTAGGTFNQPFSYTITATNSPTDFDALNLPLNLSINFTSGVISGNPAQTGVFNVNIAAANSSGIGIADLKLTIAKGTAGVSISNTSQVSNGSPKQVTVTTSPAGLTTNVTYNGSATPPSAVGTYAVVATVSDANYQGSASSTLTITSPTTVVPPPTIVDEPDSVTKKAGDDVTFSVTAKGTRPLSYQWKKNGVTIPGEASSRLHLQDIDASDAGVYTVVVTNAGGSDTSHGARLTVLLPPTIVDQPDSLTKTAGEDATFAVSATGGKPLSYQWFRNGEKIHGETSNRLKVEDVRPSDAGTYTVVVSNEGGSTRSLGASLTVLVPPTIVNEPDSTTEKAGEDVTFTVVAKGTGPLSYQWRKNGVIIPGESSNRLRLQDIDAADAGIYTVIVSNAGGSDTSHGARLTVLLPPTIVTQPVGATQKSGKSVTFTVVATGAGPLSYQWRKNGEKIHGETSNRLKLDDIRASDAGTYTVTVSNEGGTVTSAGAKLTVQ